MKCMNKKCEKEVVFYFQGINIYVIDALKFLILNIKIQR